jgi:hypothetical protein
MVAGCGACARKAGDRVGAGRCRVTCGDEVEVVVVRTADRAVRAGPPVNVSAPPAPFSVPDPPVAIIQLAASLPVTSRCTSTIATLAGNTNDSPRVTLHTKGRRNRIVVQHAGREAVPFVAPVL